MNYEATIGIVSGIVTIATAAIGVVKLYKPVSAAKLFVQLTDKKLTDKQHKAALKRLNSTKLLNKRISQDYINGFSLSG